MVLTLTLLYNDSSPVPRDDKDPLQVKLLGKHSLGKVIAKGILPPGTAFFTHKATPVRTNIPVGQAFGNVDKVALFARMPRADMVVELSSMTLGKYFPRFYVASETSMLGEVFGLPNSIEYSVHQEPVLTYTPLKVVKTGRYLRVHAHNDAV